MAGQGRNIRAVLAVGVCVAALSSCSWKRLEESSSTTISGEMRPVPTVPAATDPTATVPTDPADAAAVGAETTPDEPDTPPTTELVGDPQPDPDSEVTLPPLPDSPAIDACTALTDAGTLDVIGAAAGTGAAAETIGEEACRITAGAVVAEVHYVDEARIDDDWFVRDGIEPVGDVSPDAVGVRVFAPPGSSAGDGFSIGMIHRRQGVVVAVRGAADDRALAVELATLVGTTI